METGEIPEDIRKKARKIAKESIYHGGIDWAMDDIARALLAERKRSVQIVVDHFAPNQGEGMHPAAIETIRAIRS